VLFALTDHDTCGGSSAAQVAGAVNIRAVEISCADEQGLTVHILAYEPAGADVSRWDLLLHGLVEVREQRKHRLRMMAAKLSQRGINVDISGLVDEADRRSVGRPDLAKAMVAAGAVSSMKEAFSRFLYDRGPVDVPHKALTVAQAVKLARSAGAQLSLAHPHLYENRTLHLIENYRDAGLSGIEAFYGRYDAAERKRWCEIADAHGMVCTGGSDSHGEPEIARGVEMPEARAEVVHRWLGL
jgi:3',5'-nucleoside bisphosphate phosphatase